MNCRVLAMIRRRFHRSKRGRGYISRCIALFAIPRRRMRMRKGFAMNYAVRDHRAARAYEAKSLAEIVRNFTPNWFTVTMGTGALALTIKQFPLEIPALHDGAVVLWLANIALFSLFSIAYAARWVFFFDGARRIFDHPVMSMFFGAIPMGLATILKSSARPCSAMPQSPSPTSCGGSMSRCRSPAGLPSLISCSRAKSTAWRS